MSYVFATPGHGYLQQLGALAYGVASLEWTVLGDLPVLQDHLPAGLQVDQLVGKSTGQIAHALAHHANAIRDDQVRHFVEVGARVLLAAAQTRNDVLHARPATIEGQQRLYRWTTRPGQQFVISETYLDESIALIGRLLYEIDAARVTNTG